MSLKINIDRAFMQNEIRGATGAVIRGSDGRLHMASAQWINSAASALLAEAEALQDGVYLIPAGVREHIIVETDLQVLVLLWRNRAKHWSEGVAILEDVID